MIMGAPLIVCCNGSFSFAFSKTFLPLFCVQLADEQWGVISIKWKEVGCGK